MRGITTSTSPQPTMAPEPTVAPERWRKDQRCGKNAAPLPEAWRSSLRYRPYYGDFM